MKEEITQDWKNSILSLRGTEEKWCLFRDKLKNLESKFVPVKMFKEDNDRKERHTPLDRETQEAIRKKHRCW